MTIQKIINKSGKTQGEVARHLGLTWRNLYYRMQDPRRFNGVETAKLLEIIPDAINWFTNKNNHKR